MSFLPPDPTIDLHWSDYRGAIHEIFASNAQEFPHRVCVTETKSRHRAQRQWTYGQIHASSNQLVSRLLANECEVGDVVAIYAYRGVDLVVAYLGALKAGATVCVLDPQYPPDRQIVLLDVARPRFLLTLQRANDEFGKPSEAVMEFVTQHLRLKDFIAGLELSERGDLVPPHAVDNARLAQVRVGPDSAPTLSFTSGSEGRPKGVLGRHFSLTYYTSWMASRFGLSEADRFTMLSGIAHDPIQRDIFTPLFLGAQIVIPPAEVITYEVLAEWIDEYRLTVTHLTPAMGQILVGGATTSFPSLRNAFFVGDLLTKKDTRKLRDLAPNTAVINLYGTTETQRAVSFFEIPSKAQDPAFLDQLPDVIPVGQGMLHVQLLVVDRDDKTRLCAVGEQGELFLRAAGLAEGYLGDDERTAALNTSKFVPNWFVKPGSWAYEPQRRSLDRGPRDRVYRTGDLGRVRTDGSIECTGRIDSQVKIRGFRIELGEIDIALSQHPFVRENVTLVRRNMNEEATLVTYFVPESHRWFQHLDQQADKHTLEQHLLEETMAGMLRRFKSLSENCKQFLATKVPQYAVPTMFIPLARMPLNPNGKIDKPSLPFPDSADLLHLGKRRASSVHARMTETQRRLATIWATVLPDRTARMLAPESNFFDEGGHSILVQKLFFRLKQEWTDLDLPLRVIFQSQTLGDLAAEIDRAQDPIGLRLDTMPLSGDAARDDEAYAADARGLAQQLPTAATATNNVRTVFLTGATGFLGSYLVRELLDGPAKVNRVIALVRADDVPTGLARLEATSRRYNLWSPTWNTRLEVVVGDLAQPQLGLASVWTRLVDEIDLVVHNGARVHWMLPYASLRAANVLSTLACIQLCATGRPKRLAFVSSTSVLDSEFYSRQITPVLESDDLEGSRKGLATGYGQTKWASEYLVRAAGQRGLTSVVIRPGYVTGDPSSGISITDDFLVRLWKGCVQVGARPDIPAGLNAVPVTDVSRTIIAAALHRPRGVVQVTCRPRGTMNAWMAALEEYGYRVPMVTYAEWCARVKQYVADEEQTEEHALLPLFHSVTEDLPATSEGPELDNTDAMAALKAYGVEDSGSQTAISLSVLGKYLAYLVAIAFLPAPLAGGKRELPPMEGMMQEAPRRS